MILDLTQDITGKIIFEDDCFKILKLNLVSAESTKLEKVFPVYLGKDCPVPRFQQYMLLLNYNKGFDNIVEKLEQRHLDNPTCLDTQFILLTLKRYKGLSLDDLFHVGTLDDTAQCVYFMSHNMVFSVSNQQVTLSFAGREAAPPVAILFANEFERIIVPIGIKDRVGWGKISKLLAERIAQKCISTSYLVLLMPTLIEKIGDTTIYSNQVNDMSIEQMLGFFGISKKAGTKFDTFVESLRTMSSRYRLDKSDEEIFILVTDDNKTGTRNNVLPLDYLLSIALHLEIIAHEEESGDTKIIARQRKEENYDFAEFLYNSLEKNGHCTIFAFGQSEIEKSLEKLA